MVFTWKTLNIVHNRKPKMQIIFMPQKLAVLVVLKGLIVGMVSFPVVVVEVVVVVVVIVGPVVVVVVSVGMWRLLLLPGRWLLALKRRHLPG